MLALCETLRAMGCEDSSSEPATQAAVQAILDQLARSYTMADERDVHNRSLGERYSGIQTTSDCPGVEGAEDDDEDDGLF